MSNELTTKTEQTSLLSPGQFEHWAKVASKIANSQLVPKEMRGRPEDVLLAMDAGHSLGLKPTQAVQSICIINGRPAVWGDTVLALIQGHPDYEYHKETPILKNNELFGYQCIIKRKGLDEHCEPFTIDDAKKANLWGKRGPWQEYPQRMLKLRARGFALRDTFADVLSGIKLREEVMDYQHSNTQGETKNKAADSLNDILKSKEQSKTSQETEKTNDDIVEAEYIEPVTDMQLNSIHDLIAEINLSDERIKKAKALYQVESFTDMTAEQAGHFMSQLIKEKEKGL